MRKLGKGRLLKAVVMSSGFLGLLAIRAVAATAVASGS
jgi:hypothetical protein